MAPHEKNTVPYQQGGIDPKGTGKFFIIISFITD